jgi:DNA helicase II / ATP-dependent DNA helicase PcrA
MKKRSRSAAAVSSDVQLDLTPIGEDNGGASDVVRRVGTPAPTPGFKPWESGMNEEQARGIAHTNGPLYVGAVAGCGKTRMLVNRIARLVADGQDPARILAVTFSKKAAEEMNERLDRDLDITSARVGTWHSLCLEIIRKDLPQGEWRIDDKERYRQFVKDAIGYRYLNWSGADLTKVCSFIGVCKANLFGADSPEAAELAQQRFGFQGSKATRAYHIADDICHGQGLLTFDDMLIFAARHLESDEVADEWSANWDHVMVDEAQDNSQAQIFIATRLARTHRNIMAVGDLAQAIYGFRGSSPEYLAAFEGQWSATAVYMNRNYRSGRAIIAAANKAIAPAKVRLPVEMIAMRDFEGSAKAMSLADLDDEARAFVGWIQEQVASGRSFSDITALFRTNAQSRALEEALLATRIPYVVVGGTSFYERREVKSLLAYLRVAADLDATGEAVKKCINAPFRFLGAAFVDRVEEVASDSNEDWTSIVESAARSAGVQRRQTESALEWARLITTLRKMMSTPEGSDESKPATMLRYVVERTRYIDWLVKEEGEESVENSRASNVRELCRVAEKFGTVKELLKYIDESIKAATAQRRAKAGERVLLMSIHRSKGLEWPCVWVVGCNDRILPHAKGDVEEERRLFYVACTRARDALVCSYVGSMATSLGVSQMAPSRFLADAGLLVSGAEVEL